MVNQPPSGGSFAVKPGRGVALETPFELAARNWVDAEGHYPLRYRFSLGADALLAVQSASSRASYTGVLSLPPGAGAIPASPVSVSCTVEDSLGATTTVTQAVGVEPPALALSDPASFLAEQAAATQALLAHEGGAEPGSAALVRALLSLLQCAEVLNDPRATKAMDAQARVRRRCMRVLDECTWFLCIWSRFIHTLPLHTCTCTHMNRRHSGRPCLNALSRPPSASSNGQRAAAALTWTAPLWRTLCCR